MIQARHKTIFAIGSYHIVDGEKTVSKVEGILKDFNFEVESFIPPNVSNKEDHLITFAKPKE